MSDSDTCVCGHVRDEHGGDPVYPGSTACTVEGDVYGHGPCRCIAFEEDPGDGNE